MADKFVNNPQNLNTEQQRLDTIQQPSTSNIVGMDNSDEAALSSIDLSSILPLMEAITLAHGKNESENSTLGADNSNIAGDSTDSMIIKALEGLAISGALDEAIFNDALSQFQDAAFCSSCTGYVETRYHCTICDDFDLCLGCFEKDGHPHKMEKLDLDVYEESSLPSNQKPEAKKLLFQHHIQCIEHACQCENAYCTMSQCQKYKRIARHNKVCRRKQCCLICKQFIALCCYHAKNCQKTKCNIPFCSSIKRKWQLKQLQERRQQALFSRRMTDMNVEDLLPVEQCQQIPCGAGQGTMQPGSQLIQLQGNAGFNNPGNTMHQHAWQQLKLVLRSPESPQQQQPKIIKILKSNPELMEAYIKERQIMQQAALRNEPLHDAIPTVTPCQSALNNPVNISTTFKEHLLQKLKQSTQSPQSPEQSLQILQILKEHPTIMAEFIKMQKAEALAQQGAAGGVREASTVPQPLRHAALKHVVIQHQQHQYQALMLGQGGKQLAPRPSRNLTMNPQQKRLLLDKYVRQLKKRQMKQQRQQTLQSLHQQLLDMQERMCSLISTTRARRRARIQSRQAESVTGSCSTMELNADTMKQE